MKYVGSPPIFRDDKKVLPLQAADLYAWSVRRHLFNNKLITVPMRREMRALQDLENIEHQCDFKAICHGVLADAMIVSKERSS